MPRPEPVGPDSAASAAGTARTGFVLAGGGFKGAFELGALRHLIAELGITPDVVASASAGSILGMVLSQGRTRPEFVDQLDHAQRTLLAMTRTELVFGHQEWLGEFKDTDFARRVISMVTDRSAPDVPGGDPDPDRTTPDRTAPGHTAPGAALDHVDGDVDGRRSERRRRPREWPELSTMRDQLRAAARARRTLTGTTSSVLTLDPFEQAIRGQVDVGIPPVRPELIGRPGIELRMAVTAVRRRETHYVCQDGTIVGPDAVTPLHDGAAPVGVIDGAIASSSVPMVFPARRLGDDTYVDGGCLQNIPLAAAVSQGAERIFTVVAAPLRHDGDEAPRSRAPMWAAKELGFLETQEANLAIPLPEGTSNTVIAPTLDVVGAFEVHRGLMQIDIDYGWMRAQEVMAGPDAGLAPVITAATDAVTTQRLRAWHLELSCLRAGEVSPTRLAALRELKSAVRSAVHARAALGFDPPPGADAWWGTWETHSLPVPDTFPADLA